MTQSLNEVLYTSSEKMVLSVPSGDIGGSNPTKKNDQSAFKSNAVITTVKYNSFTGSMSNNNIGSIASSGLFRKYIGKEVNETPTMNIERNRRQEKSKLRQVTQDLVSLYSRCNKNFKYEKKNAPRRLLTKLSQPAGNFGYDNSENNLILRVNDVLSSPHSGDYIVLDILGQGTFGQVFRCQEKETGKVIAVKIIKNHPSYYKQAIIEVHVAKMLNEQYDPEDTKHIVRLLNYFKFRGHLCLAFELLSINLYEVLSQNMFCGLSLEIVRGVIAQILEALSLLGDADVIHCDLKPENILLAGGEQKIFFSQTIDGRSGDGIGIDVPVIKLIDFGSACFENQTLYSYIQSRFYRSPEVLLGLGYDGAIDMWSLGCISAEIFLGLPLFPGASEHDQIKLIFEMLGYPDDDLLTRSKHLQKFFKKNPNTAKYYEQMYVLKSSEEFAEYNKSELACSKKYFQFSTLEEIIDGYLVSSSVNSEEMKHNRERRATFSHFLRGLLCIDPNQRWTPRQAATHPFITGQKFDPSFKPSDSLKRHRMRRPMKPRTNDLSSWHVYQSSPQGIPLPMQSDSCRQHVNGPHSYPLAVMHGTEHSYPPAFQSSHLQPDFFTARLHDPGATHSGHHPSHPGVLRRGNFSFDGRMEHSIYTSHAHASQYPGYHPQYVSSPAHVPSHSVDVPRGFPPRYHGFSGHCMPLSGHAPPLSIPGSLGNWHPPVSAPRSYGGMGASHYSPQAEVATYLSPWSRPLSSTSSPSHTFQLDEELTPPAASTATGAAAVHAEWDPFFMEGVSESMNGGDSPGKSGGACTSGLSWLEHTNHSAREQLFRGGFKKANNSSILKKQLYPQQPSEVASSPSLYCSPPVVRQDYRRRRGRGGGHLADRGRGRGRARQEKQSGSDGRLTYQWKGCGAAPILNSNGEPGLPAV